MIEAGPVLTDLLAAGVLAAAGLLFWLVVRCLCAIPVAQAWNPESHEKMICYALEILAREEKATLLGWVLRQAEEKHKRGDSFFHRHGILQMRRGSIDEDMHSDLLVSLEPFWQALEEVMESDAAKSNLSALQLRLLRAVAPKGAFLGEWITRGLSKAVKPALDLEGTNGGYHFHNPLSQNAVKGLSDPVELSLTLKKQQDEGLMRGLSTPMPSASDRALKEDTPEGWWMDREKRTYTVGDATRYYERGYLHLALYAAGRVAHLLQDMAVPAHVRDDAHFGMGGDPADPLEYFAAYEDWKAHFGEGWTDVSAYSVPLPLGGLKASGVFLRWVFDPQRVWDPATQRHHLEKAIGEYEERKQAFLQVETLSYEHFFDTLATRTHENHYSHGTIPGNADAHNPNNTKERLPWVPQEKPDFAKCKPSTGAFLEVLDMLRALAERVTRRATDMRDWALRDSEKEVEWGHLIDPDYGRRDVSRRPGENSRQIEIEKDLDAWLAHYQPLREHCQRLEALVSTFRQDLRVNVPEMMDHLKAIDQLLPEIKALPLSPHMTEVALQGADAREIADEKKALDADIDTYHRRYERLKPELLVQCLGNRPLAEALQEWIIRYPNRQQLAMAFQGTHGPCCLINDREAFQDKSEDDLALIRRQYDDCESSAIAYTALLLARWFESLYSPAPRLGLALWQNQDALHGQAPPRMERAGGTISNGQPIVLPGHLFTLGAANNLPLEVDLEISLSYQAPAEPDESYAFAQEVFSEGIPIGGCIHQVEGGRHARREEIQARLFLTGGRPAAISVADLCPHSAPAVNALALPDRGGILREAGGKLVPVPACPDSAQDWSRMAAAVVRIEFGEKLPETDPGPGPVAPDLPLEGSTPAEEPGPFPEQSPRTIYDTELKR